MAATKFGLLVSAALVPMAALAGPAQILIPPVTTAYGPVQGFAVGGTNQWRGIPYAQPPVGALRFYPPQAPSNFSGTFSALNYSSSCPQSGNSFGINSTNEDCLYLNITAPAASTATSRLPVMVWIHGGAYVNGEGFSYDPTAMVTQGNVIVVTINYRLGLLGFLAHPALAATDPAGSTGNYGIQDQQAAIAWVKQNIAAFGGNPNNITIFGESAGGQSVEIQLTAPATPKLHGAIIESGDYNGALPTFAAAEASGQALAANTLGCATGDNTAIAACLRALPVATLVMDTPTQLLGVSPNVDGTTIPLQPVQAFNTGAFQHVPLINGSNHDEFRLFVAIDDFEAGDKPSVTAASYMSTVQTQFGPAATAVLAAYPLSNYASPDLAYAAVATDYAFACGAHLVNALVAQYAPVYSYELNDPKAPDLFLPPDVNLPDLGDSHASELPYIFPALVGFTGTPATFSASQSYLASTMRAFWTSFARYGRPVAPRSGVWQSYNNAGLVMSLVPPAPGLESNFVSGHQCAFWKQIILTVDGLPSTVPY
jgi:para-nitrobenzyl esterase